MFDEITSGSTIQEIVLLAAAELSVGVPLPSPQLQAQFERAVRPDLLPYVSNAYAAYTLLRTLKARLDAIVAPNATDPPAPHWVEDDKHAPTTEIDATEFDGTLAEAILFSVALYTKLSELCPILGVATIVLLPHFQTMSFTSHRVSDVCAIVHMRAAFSATEDGAAATVRAWVRNGLAPFIINKAIRLNSEKDKAVAWDDHKHEDWIDSACSCFQHLPFGLINFVLPTLAQAHPFAQPFPPELLQTKPNAAMSTEDMVKRATKRCENVWQPKAFRWLKPVLDPHPLRSIMEWVRRLSHMAHTYFHDVPTALSSQNVPFHQLPGLPRFEGPATPAECALLPYYAFAVQREIEYQHGFWAYLRRTSDNCMEDSLRDRRDRYMETYRDPEIVDALMHKLKTRSAIRSFHCQLGTPELDELAHDVLGACEEHKQRWLAVHMGLHPRLGKDSAVSWLDENLLQYILRRGL